MDAALGYAAPPLAPPPPGDEATEAAVPALLAYVRADARRFEFDQAVLLMERVLGTDALRTGRLRIRPRTSPAFPVSDVERIDVGDDGGVTTEVTFLGLYGASAALPGYFTEPIAHEEADALRAFLDLFNRRIYALYHEAWRKYHPRYRFEAGEEGEPAATPADARPFVAFTGLAPDAEPVGLPLSPLRLAALGGRFAMRVRNATGLRDLLGHFLGHPVAVSENEPRWVPMPRRGRLGAPGTDGFSLGTGALLGGRIYDVSGKVRVVVGPLDLPDFRALMPGGERAPLLAGLVRFYLPDGLDFDVELLLRERQAHALVLGDGVSRLGRNAWVGSTGSGIVSEIVSYN